MSVDGNGFRGYDILKSVEFNFMDIWQCTLLLCFGVHTSGVQMMECVAHLMQFPCAEFGRGAERAVVPL